MFEWRETGDWDIFLGPPDHFQFSKKTLLSNPEVADSVDTRVCPQTTVDIDGLRYSPDDTHYRLAPVHTSLYVRVV